MSLPPRIVKIGANLGRIEGDLDRVRAQIDALGLAGAECVEMYAPALGVVAAARPITSRLAELKAICAERPVAFTLHAPIPVDFMDRAHIGLHRAAARVSVDLAAEIGATIVVIHAGRATPDDWARDADGLLALERDELAVLGDHARSAGVTVALENISPNPAVIAGRATSYSLDPAALARQLAALDHPAVTGCLDYSHANQGAGLQGHALIDGVAAMAPRTGHIHVSDTTGVPAPASVPHDYWMYYGVGDAHAPLGTGGIDLDALAGVSRVRPGTFAVLELQFSARGMMADSLARLRAFADRVNRLDAEAAAD